LAGSRIDQSNVTPEPTIYLLAYKRSKLYALHACFQITLCVTDQCKFYFQGLFILTYYIHNERCLLSELV